jgi:hypothetical protein
MTTVAIDSTLYDVYASVADADLYLNGLLNATAWAAATELQKSQALITATRTMDRQCWVGDKTMVSGQELQWPRTNTGIDGVEDDIVPADIINGCIELANLLMAGSNVQSTTTPNGQGLQIIKAGSVSLTYFRPGLENYYDQNARFPIPVQELVGKYMCGATAALVGTAYGAGVTTDRKTQSVTNDEFPYNDGI